MVIVSRRQGTSISFIASECMVPSFYMRQKNNEIPRMIVYTHWQELKVITKRPFVLGIQRVCVRVYIYMDEILLHKRQDIIVPIATTKVMSMSLVQ